MHYAHEESRVHLLRGLVKSLGMRQHPKSFNYQTFENIRDFKNFTDWIRKPSDTPYPSLTLNNHAECLLLCFPLDENLQVVLTKDNFLSDCFFYLIRPNFVLPYFTQIQEEFAKEEGKELPKIDDLFVIRKLKKFPTLVHPNTAEIRDDESGQAYLMIATSGWELLRLYNEYVWWFSKLSDGVEKEHELYQNEKFQRKVAGWAAVILTCCLAVGYLSGMFPNRV